MLFGRRGRREIGEKVTKFLGCKRFEQTGGHQGSSGRSEVGDLVAGNHVILPIETAKNKYLWVFLNLEATQYPTILGAKDVVFVAFANLGAWTNNGEENGV